MNKSKIYNLQINVEKSSMGRGSQSKKMGGKDNLKQLEQDKTNHDIRW